MSSRKKQVGEKGLAHGCPPRQQDQNSGTGRRSEAVQGETGSGETGSCAKVQGLDGLLERGSPRIGKQKDAIYGRRKKGKAEVAAMEMKMW